MRPGSEDPCQWSVLCVFEILLSHEGKHTQVSAGVGHHGPFFLGIGKCQFPTAKLWLCFVPGHRRVGDKMHSACGKGERSTLLAVKRALNFSFPELNKALRTFFIPVPWVKNMV